MMWPCGLKEFIIDIIWQPENGNASYRIIASHFNFYIG
jgi:hypothetical protein